MFRLTVLLAGAIAVLTPADALGLTADSGDELLRVTGDAGRDELRMRVEGADVVLKSPEEIVVGPGCVAVVGGARCAIPGGEDPGPVLRLRGGPDLVLLDESLSPAQLQPFAYLGAGDDLIGAGGVFLGTYHGQRGNDRMVGDGTLVGGKGDDGLFGQRNDDILIGGAGRDHLHGRGGRDDLLGGAGDDFLDGGRGFDRGGGGPGADTEVSIEVRLGSR